MIAHSFAQNGATVYISGRRKDVLDKVAGSFGSLEGAVYPYVHHYTNYGWIDSPVQRGL